VGLEAPARGRIAYDGIDSTRLAQHEIRRCCGAVLQDEFLPSATLLRHLAGEADISIEEIYEVLDVVGLGPLVARLPFGLQALADSIRFSQGEVRRILLARALLRKPRFLVLDEALGSFERERRGPLFAAIRRFGASCMVISHDRDILSFADQCVEM
jgi:ABC-type bacteriocin/lantibiotic exporter with double-glycine peptidase domain